MCWLKNVWLTGGVDFNTTPLTATFVIGIRMSNVSVPVINDDIIEERERFNLIINVPASLGPRITAVNKNSAVGVIIDSTSK